MGERSNLRQRRVRQSIAAAACVSLVALLAACASAPKSAQAADGEPAASIELRDGQGGIAGISGTSWRIGGDGSVIVARYLNERELPTRVTGRIGAEQLADLRARFRDHGFADLPESLGVPPPINPRILSLRYGAKTVVLQLPPASPALSELLRPDMDPQQRSLIDLAIGVRRAAEGATAAGEAR
jgi:hypothetical protein